MDERREEILKVLRECLRMEAEVRYDGIPEEGTNIRTYSIRLVLREPGTARCEVLSMIEIEMDE